MKPNHITQMEVAEMEYYRILNDQITSIENLKFIDYENKSKKRSTGRYMGR